MPTSGSPSPGGPAPGALSALLRAIASPPGEAVEPVRDPAPGTALGRYVAVRVLGRGGFGTVLEARDDLLGRSVALKLFRPGRSWPATAAAQAEAEVVARLSHPNLVQIFDAGTCPEGPFLVFELLRGETLARRLEAGALPVPEAVRIALGISRGLAHAHAHGVVHRDLTPRNVFLGADGQVKVLDLGLAHALGHRKVDGGTAGYMAPEQERGAPEDERTDVYALGVLAHRMLSGTMPPGGGRAPRLDLPELPALGSLIARMLSPDPVARPRDCGQVAEALAEVPLHLSRIGAGGRARASAAAGPTSVAVLPFADLSPEHDREWLCDGIAEEILQVLAGLSGLRVASRSASFQFKGRSLDAREMARAIGVTTLLEGSVRAAGPRVRIAARMVGEDGYEIWSRTFDRVLEDVFAVQEEIAQAVAQALDIRLSTGEVKRLQRHGTRNARALERYLRARHLQIAKPELARDILQEAIALDPRFAEAHAALADVDSVLLQWRLPAGRDREALCSEALTAAEEALRLDADLAEAHVARANTRALVGDGPGAEEEFGCATALNPGLGRAWYFLGRFLFSEGRYAEAAEAFEEATRCDPEDYNAAGLLPMVYRNLGDREREAIAIDRAAAASERWLRLNPEDVRVLYFLGFLIARRGERSRGRELVERAIALRPDTFDVQYNAACFYAAVGGELDLALDALDRAVAGGRGNRSWIEKDPDLGSIRDHPRYAAILARIPP